MDSTPRHQSTKSNRRGPSVAVRRLAAVASLAAFGLVGVSAPASGAGGAPGQPIWRTVVNNGDLVPGTEKTFNSYNQPSVNTSGLVAFRARSRGGVGGEPMRGVYSRNPLRTGSPITVVADVATAVPQPNNLDATFNEFPSTPRIDRVSSTIATRGQSQPVWLYVMPDLTETRMGTSGIYTTVNGSLATGASLLGTAPGYEYFAVPGASPGTRFSQFPGSPAVDGTTIAFKGNYTDAVTVENNTGVYFRNVAVPNSPFTMVANSQTVIPNQDPSGAVEFGSTSPPSAANGYMVFLGLDNEDDPTLGGIYLAPMTDNPTLQTLVSIGDQVPGMEPSDRFTRLGEGLSFDGRFVAFWGAWGHETTPITLQCPTDGNADLRAFCNTTYPTGYDTVVPTHQGMFVLDTQTNAIQAVAVTDARFSTFQYWVFSGKPPGGEDTEEESQELPRWRNSAFAAVSGYPDGTYRAAFKASLVGGGSGIYLAHGPTTEPLETVLDTTVPGTSVDPEAPADTVVSSVGIERDGFRGNYLALSAGMVNIDASASWAGIYLVTLGSPYRPVGPARLLETRSGAGYGTVDGLFAGLGARGAGSVTELQVAGRAGVPVDASAVELNVTVTNANGAGFVTVYPCGSPRPLSSNVNYGAGSTVANSVIAKIGVDGKVCVFTQAGVDLIVDTSGYFPIG